MLSLAKRIDPDAWQLHPMLHRRVKSIEAAIRVQTYFAAQRAIEIASSPRPWTERLFRGLFRRAQQSEVGA